MAELLPEVEPRRIDIPPEEEREYTARESFVSGLQRQNWGLGLTGATLGGDFEFTHDPEYKFEDDSLNERYPPETMWKARNDREAALFRHQIDQEQLELKKIHNSSWGLVGEAVGGMTQPNVIAGVMVAPVSIPALIVTEAGLEVGAETLLHDQQRTRTMQESAFNVGFVAAGAGILGGATRLLGSKAEVKEYLQPMPEDLSVGARQAFASTMEDETMAGGKIVEALAIGPLQRVLRSSSQYARVTAQRLVDSPFFTKGHEKGKTWGVPVEAEVDSAMGRVAATADEVSVLQKESGLDVESFDVEVGRAMSMDDAHTNQQVADAAVKYREKVVDPILKDAQEVGLLPKTKEQLLPELEEYRARGVDVPEELLKRFDDAPENLTKFAESYFPRIYRKEAILDDWDNLIDLLSGHFARDLPDYTPDELKRLSMDTMSNMMGGVPTRLAGKPAALKERVLSLTDEILEPYLEKRATAVMMRHAQGMNPYIAVRKRFGDVSMADQVDRIKEEYLGLIDKAPTEGAKRKLIHQRDRDIHDIEFMRDRVLHRAMEADDPANGMKKAVQAGKAFNISTQLGGVVLSSTPDLARPLMQYGFRSYGKGLAHYFGALFTPKTSMPKAQVKRLGIALERQLNQRMHDLTDTTEVASKYVNWSNRLWGKLSLFNHWTDAVESIAAHSSMDWTIRQAGNVVSGKRLSRATRAKLANMGFDEDALREVYAEATSTMGAQDKVLKYANTLEWKNHQLAKKFEAAIGSDVRRVIVRVGAGDKPKFMDSHLWSWILQYQSFGMAATNKMLVAGLQSRDLAMASGLLSGIALGAAASATKAWLRGDDPSKWDADKWVLEGIDRSGLLGIYSPALSVLQYATGEVPSRYLHRGARGAIAGPTAGQIERGFKLGTSLAEGEYEKAAEHAQRMTPFLSNTLHMRQLMQRMAED